MNLTLFFLKTFWRFRNNNNHVQMDKHTMEELQKRFGRYSIQTSWALFYFPRAFTPAVSNTLTLLCSFEIQLFAN